jgi:flagellar biosynthesis protein FlhB
MAQQDDRTEKPTPKRRKKARSEGRVARSVEISSASVLVATLAALALTAPTLLRECEALMREGLLRSGSPDAVGSGALGNVSMWGLMAFAKAAAPVVFAAAGAGVLSSVAQVGLRFTPKAIKPSFKKLNPAQGLKRMFGPQQGVELLKAVVKLVIVGGVAGSAVWSRLPTLGSMVGMPPGALLVELAHLVLSIALRAVGAFALVAAADYAWQRRKHEKSLKMSKQDVKQEMKESDLAPELRGQMRRRQAEQARKRMLADVPTADVVVVNPTHYAVALRYDGAKAAPEVVAKGLDHIALTIRRVAEEAGVAIVHEPPLARALYRDVEIGQQIPEQFFQAVAEVLAFVFRTAGRRRRVA